MFGDDKSVNNTGGDQSSPQLPDDTGGDQLPPPLTDNTGHDGGINGTDSTLPGNGEGLVDLGPNHTGTPVDVPDVPDVMFSLKGKDAQNAAAVLGFDRRVPAQKAPFNSHGQPVFTDGKNYITPDVDSHNVTNGWKMFDRKGRRTGTYNDKLKRIKD